MSKKLLIVESAKKARTIKGMLGGGFTVRATSGHILEMPPDDIHVNLQHFKQQKTVIDHVAEKLAQLDFSIKQADVLTKELQEERRLAGRIYQAIRSMRKPGTPPPPKPAPPKPVVQPDGAKQTPVNGE